MSKPSPKDLASSLLSLTHPNPNPNPKPNPKDLASSVLSLTTWTLGQLGAVTAELHKCKEVFFVGGFVDKDSMPGLTYAVEQCSGGRVSTAFIGSLSPYLGAIGALFTEKGPKKRPEKKEPKPEPDSQPEKNALEKTPPEKSGAIDSKSSSNDSKDVEIDVKERLDVVAKKVYPFITILSVCTNPYV